MYVNDTRFAWSWRTCVFKLNFIANICPLLFKTFSPQSILFGSNECNSNKQKKPTESMNYHTEWNFHCYQCKWASSIETFVIEIISMFHKDRKRRKAVKSMWAISKTNLKSISVGHWVHAHIQCYLKSFSLVCYRTKNKAAIVFDWMLFYLIFLFFYLYTRNGSNWTQKRHTNLYAFKGYVQRST